MARIERYRTSISNGLLTYRIFQILAKIGIVVEPYRYYQETPMPSTAAVRPPQGEGFEFREAGPADVDGIAALDPKRDPRDEVRRSFDSGMRCFTLRHRGRIVGATWCNVREIDYNPCRRALERDEAYFYGTQTLYEYRGQNVAGFLRAQIHAALASEGRTRFYSYTDRLNHPALRFKEKIGARVLFEGLHVRVFGLTMVDNPSHKTTAGSSSPK